MTYREHREILVAYLRVKVEVEDWHGVSDAANDLRELDAEERGRIGRVFHPVKVGERVL